MTLTRESALKSLGFPDKSEPNAREINQAYRKLALRYHPDKIQLPQGASGAQSKKLLDEQTEKFKAISEAHRLLTNPEKFSPFSNNADAHDYFTSWARNIFEEIRRREAKTFGMYVITYIDSKSSRSGYWGMQDLKEVDKQCEEFNRYPIVEIHITNGPNNNLPIKLNTQAKNLILQAMKKNDYLVKVRLPQQFFSKAQEKQLKSLLQKNRAAAKPREQAAKKLAAEKAIALNSRNRWQLFTWIIGAIVVGIVLPVANVSYFALTMKLSLSAIISGIACVAYQRFAAYSCAQIKTPSTCVGNIERTAFQLGVESKYWGGYFKSFTRSAGYFHPVAFAAGKEHALQNNPEALKKFRQSR